METLPLDTVTDLLVGTDYTLTLDAWTSLVEITGLPPGLTVEAPWGSPDSVAGTPTTEGEYTITVEAISGPGPVTVTVRPAGWEPPPEPTEVTPAAPVFDDENFTITIPDQQGAEYSVDGTPAGPKTILAEPGTTYVVTAAALEGYVLDGPAEWAHTFASDDGTPPAEEEPPALTAFIAGATGRVARMMGKPDHQPTLDMADMSVRLVMAYAEGYTRGRGWSADGVPVPGIAAVVTVAAVRLASNPRQVTYYQAGDYSERPAVLAGWSAAEVAVLRRYRRVWT